MIVGVVVGLAVLFVSLLFRVVLGVPLPIELVSDRLLPFVPVGLFVPSLGAVGGPILAKQLAFYSSIPLVIMAGVVAVRAYGRLERRRLPILAASAIGVWLLALLVLWPALASNYHGLPPMEATLLSGAALFVMVAVLAGAVYATDTVA